MFSPNTVFIVGAGASFEVGLPLGSGLKERVRELVHFEPNHGFSHQAISNAVFQIAGNNQSRLSDFAHAAERIKDGLNHVSSIDTFLDMHRENDAVVALGKIAICIAIVEAERASALTAMFNPRNLRDAPIPSDETRYRTSWYVPFGELLTQGVAMDEAESIFDNISIITFNYDRCIELFSEHLLRRAYGFGDHSRTIASKLDILHVYGKIGSLHSAEGERHLSFGRTDGTDYVSLSEGIRTFTETVDSDVDERIKQRVREADTLVFLGFGWLPQNMKLFDVGECWTKRVFYTTKGIAEPDRETIIEDLSVALKMQPESNVVTAHPTFRAFEERAGCADLLRNHWRQLTRI